MALLTSAKDPLAGSDLEDSLRSADFALRGSLGLDWTAHRMSVGAELGYSLGVLDIVDHEALEGRNRTVFLSLNLSMPVFRED